MPNSISNGVGNGGARGMDVASVINELSKQNIEAKKHEQQVEKQQPAVKLSKKDSGISGVSKNFKAEKREVKGNENVGIDIRDKKALDLGSKGSNVGKTVEGGAPTGNTSAFDRRGGGEMGVRTSANINDNRSHGPKDVSLVRGGGEMGVRGSVDVKMQRTETTTSAFNRQGGGELGVRNSTSVGYNRASSGISETAYGVRGGGEQGVRGNAEVHKTAITSATMNSGGYGTSGGGESARLGANANSASLGLGAISNRGAQGFGYSSVNSIVNAKETKGYNSDSVKNANRSLRRIKFGREYDETGEEIKQVGNRPLWAKILIGVSVTLAVVLLILFSYIGYLQLGFKRIYDYRYIEACDNKNTVVSVGSELNCITYNLNYGVMDARFSQSSYGGRSTRATSKDMVNGNITGATALVTEGPQYNADFYFFQEIDEKSTRSFNVNQREVLDTAMSNYGKMYADTLTSNYVFSPITDPLGNTLAGMAMYSKYKVNYSIRRSLPSNNGFISKYSSNDNCIIVSKLPTSLPGKYLVLINFCLDFKEKSKIKEECLSFVYDIMKTEYVDNGNYVIVGGSFGYLFDERCAFNANTPSWCDVLPANFNEESLAQIGYSINWQKSSLSSKIGTFRDYSRKYVAGASFEGVSDGFIVSGNVEVTGVRTISSEYQYSAHNPVELKFVLN